MKYAPRKLLTALVGLEVVVAAGLIIWRMNSTLPRPPAADIYTDAITGNELLALPDRFLFDSVEKWRTLGESYMSLGFFAKAEACLRRASAGEPRSAPIALSHGYCLERLGLLDEARDAYRRAVEQSRAGTAAEGWYRLGRIHLQKEQAIEAAEAFEMAGDGHLPSVYHRARLLVRGGRAVDAVPLVERLAAGHPDDLLVWQLRAQAAEALGESAAAAEARDSVERAARTLQLDEAHLRLATARETIGIGRELAQASADRNAGRNSAVADRLTRLALGEIRRQNCDQSFVRDAATAQLELGNTAMTRQLMERQIEQEKSPTARAWELLGAVEFFENQSERAWEDWGRAERMQPDGVDHRKLAGVAMQEGKEALARRHLGLAHQYAGLESFRNNRLAEAAEELRQAVSADPGLADAWYYLGESERLRGHRSSAVAALQRCLKLNPVHGRARAALNRLAHSGS
jgi:tetratricopeptide (TPR) repeat protein